MNEEDRASLSTEKAADAVKSASPLGGLLGKVWAHRSTSSESWQRYQDLASGHRSEDADPLNRPFDITTLQGIADFENEITTLKMEIAQMADMLAAEQAGRAERDEQNRELQLKLDELFARLSLGNLLAHVDDRGRNCLLRSDTLRSHFLSGDALDAYVVSIDIRRSTELMLKSRTAQQFAAFITELANDFRRIIFAQRGVFDKFTGDGILAYFTDVYSGPDAGYLAVTAAAECHKAFVRAYTANRSTFVSVLKNVGLGIGIDYGSIHVLTVADDVTIVGTPVVYACRMAGATAGSTYLNQGAYAQLIQMPNLYAFEETEVDIKHEGPTLAYAVRATDFEFRPREPEWANAD